MNGQRPQYRSIPLRTQQAKQRNTTSTHTLTQQDRVRLQEQAKQQRYMSSRDMPAMPDEDTLFLPARSHTSTKRFVDGQGNEVIRQGNQQLVIHRGKPPRRFHWLLFVGLGMMAALALWFVAQWAIAGIQAHAIDTTYGFPRTYQADAVVGHSDSPLHPSHFIFENLNGRVIVIEIPGGDIARARIYSGPTIYSANANQVPVTGKFEDVNGDGKPDMVVTIDAGTETIVFVNDGTKFVPQSQ